MIRTDVAALRSVATRSISPENFTGEKGGGGRAVEGTGSGAARDLGQGWKVSPSIQIARRRDVRPGRDRRAPGGSQHIWLTTHTDHWRSLLLRFYWDGAAEPAVEVPLGDFFGQGWGAFAQRQLGRWSPSTRTAGSTATGRCRSVRALG